MIDKLKTIFVISFIAVALFLIFAAIPFLASSPWFQSLNPVEQYAIYNIGWFIGITVGIGSVFSFVRNQKLVLKTVLVDGIAFFLFSSFVYDLWQGSFAYDFSTGAPIYSTIPAALAGTSVDRMWGFVFEQLGFHGTSLIYAVYGLVPALTIIFFAIILTRKQLMKLAGF